MKTLTIYTTIIILSIFFPSKTDSLKKSIPSKVYQSNKIDCIDDLFIYNNTPFQNLYQSNNSITTQGTITIQPNQKIEYQSNQITLNHGFGVETGSDFEVKIGSCNNTTQCVNVVDLGADNTGQLDCSPIIQEAINQGSNLCFPIGNYRLDKGITFSHDSTKHVFDQGATFFSQNSIRLVTILGNNIILDGMTINMRESSVNRFALQVLKPSSNIELLNCSVMNLKGESGVNAQAGLYIELDGVLNFKVDSCRFENIELKNDGDHDILDFAHGIYLSTSEYTNPSTGIISNCEIINVYNTSNGSDDRIDADGLRFYGGANNLPTIAESPRIEVINLSFGSKNRVQIFP